MSYNLSIFRRRRRRGRRRRRRRRRRGRRRRRRRRGWWRWCRTLTLVIMIYFLWQTERSSTARVIIADKNIIAVLIYHLLTTHGPDSTHI